MTQIEIVQGISLSLGLRLAPVVNDAPVTDLSGWAIASQVRRADGTLVATLSAAILDPAARLARLAGPTGDWPCARLLCNVVLTGPGGAPVIPSPPFEIVVIKPITRVTA